LARWIRISLSCAAAFLIAVVASMLPSALIDGFRSPIPPIFFGIALAHAAILGLPLFGLVVWLRGINFVTCLMICFTAGALPSFSFGFTDFAANNPNILAAVHRLPLFLGSREFGFSLFVGLHALVAGVVFWMALRTSGVIPVLNRTGDFDSFPRRGSHVN
jgi:hypothetical protein